MTTFTRADVILLLALAWSVLIGYGLWVLVDHCRRTRRLVKAEAAFWTSLAAFVDEARADLDAEAAEARARLRPLSDSEVARRIQAHHDAAVRELRADLENWSA